jgi:hypothetical protein
MQHRGDRTDCLVCRAYNGMATVGGPVADAPDPRPLLLGVDTIMELVRDAPG